MKSRVTPQLLLVMRVYHQHCSSRVKVKFKGVANFNFSDDITVQLREEPHLR